MPFKSAPDETTLEGLLRRLIGEHIGLDPYLSRCLICPWTSFGRIDDDVTEDDLIVLQARVQFLLGVHVSLDKDMPVGKWIGFLKASLGKNGVPAEEARMIEMQACKILREYLGLAQPEQKVLHDGVPIHRGLVCPAT